MSRASRSLEAVRSPGPGAACARLPAGRWPLHVGELDEVMTPLGLKHAVASIVYVSASAPPIVAALRDVVEEAVAIKQSGTESATSAKLVHVFSDSFYNRTSFLIAGSSPQSVANAAFELTAAAIEMVPDLSEHVATHPRIGVVDHISFAPLCPPVKVEGTEFINAAVNMSDAASAASFLASSLAKKLDLPVMIYGEARFCFPGFAPRSLAETRRQTPYFRRPASRLEISSIGTWSGVVPDLGGPVIDPRRGVCCVGAAPLVLNYNVRLKSTDRRIAAAAAAAVRTRQSPGMESAGLPFVEALPLVHKDGYYEVACNLLDPSVTSVPMVLDRITTIARDFNVDIDEAYIIGLTVDAVREKLVG